MILIDALYINNSGGKILLDYLIENLECTNLDIIYLFDSRINYPTSIFKSTNKIYYTKASTLNRLLFYLKHKKMVHKIFCFGNVPPILKIKNVTVYTYFHQMLFLKIPENIGIKMKMNLFFKKNFIFFFKNNTNYWLLQSEEMKNLFIKNNIENYKIKTIPFYKPFKKLNLQKIKNTFLYVSSGETHKNHLNLLNAFSKFYLKYKIGKLILTISNDYQNLLSVIQDYKAIGIPIINYTYLNREDLTQIYNSTEFVIYPSLLESFGLGLAEAIDTDCKILSSDLNWSKSICIASDYFNPLSVESIENSLIRAVNNNLSPSRLIIKNQIDSLIKNFYE